MAYESLINEAKKYLQADSSKYEEYYRKAADSIRSDYEYSVAQLQKQYEKDKNNAAAQSILSKRNADQQLAARGLSRSGESVQEQINSSITLSNAMNSLADTNARQLTELAKNKASDLRTLEEKAIDRQAEEEKRITEQAIEAAKAENAKAEREEDIALQDRRLAEEREYEKAKIESQREYEDSVRAAEHELEAQIRAEQQRIDAEKAEKEQQYKIDYYNLLQSDKERLIEEERAYNDKKADEERQYAEAQKEADRKYEEALREYERIENARLLAEQRAYESSVRETEYENKVKLEQLEQEAKTALYALQQADKERLIAEQRAYEASKSESASNGTADNSASASLNSTEQAYVKTMVKNILAAATDGESKFTTATQKVEAYKILQELLNQGTPSTYISAIAEGLTTAGYSTPDESETNEAAMSERLDEVYRKSYGDTMYNLSKENLSAAIVKSRAAAAAVVSQLEYLYKHCSSLEAFYSMCTKVGIEKAKADEFLQSRK